MTLASCICCSQLCMLPSRCCNTVSACCRCSVWKISCRWCIHKMLLQYELHLQHVHTIDLAEARGVEGTGVAAWSDAKHFGALCCMYDHDAPNSAEHRLFAAGVLLSKAELQRASDLCERAGAWLVMDNTYENFTYEGREHTCVSGSHVINIFSMSKVRITSALQTAVNICSVLQP